MTYNDFRVRDPDICSSLSGPRIKSHIPVGIRWLTASMDRSLLIMLPPELSETIAHRPGTDLSPSRSRSFMLPARSAGRPDF